VTGEAAVKAALAAAFEKMRPASATSKVEAAAVEISEDMIRQRLLGGAKPAAPAAPAAAPTAPPPAGTEVPEARFIPPEMRQFLGKIIVTADVSPPLGAADVQRRVDTLVRDRYPDSVGAVFKVEGKTAAGPGEFQSFELWIRDDFAGRHGETPSPQFWADVVKSALGQEEAFASTTSFEPTMAGEAWDKAVIAILLSLGLMLVYIWFRFAKFSSGVAAVIALIHDVLVTLGLVTVSAYLSDTALGTTFLLTDMKVNLAMVGAFLTLIGYSMNDTIVVFDRIRENRGKYGELSAALVSNSINQTLSRTVLTSFTVFVAVVALYAFGGKTSSIHGFSFVMLCGTVIGTYSSIAIASPILVLLDYLKRVYAVAYPIVVAGLLAYYIGFYKVTENSPGMAWAVLGAIFLLICLGVWWGAASQSFGKPWLLLEKAPKAAKLLALAGLLVPFVAVILAAIAVLSRTAGVAAWAGPAAAVALSACPAVYTTYRLALKNPVR
jgi:preprotein translocase SecF subunit